MRNENCYKKIDFMEQDLRVKILTTPFELQTAYAFRHKIFAEELRWVPTHPTCLENDQYDKIGMTPLGVFDHSGQLAAYLRITLPHRRFMMENEFASLIETPIKKTDGTVEVSRVCTEKKIRKTLIETPSGSFHMSMLLYKGLYQWCIQNAVNDMYMVIEYKLFRLLKLSGFPCKKIGTPTVMPDGVSAIAVLISWQEFEQLNSRKKTSIACLV